MKKLTPEQRDWIMKQAGTHCKEIRTGEVIYLESLEHIINANTEEECYECFPPDWKECPFCGKKETHPCPDCNHVWWEVKGITGGDYRVCQKCGKTE